MPLVVFNTLTRRKEEFLPRNPGRVAMYVCGPTVYDHIHVGNARAFIVFDVIRRYLRWRGLEVKFVQNYTDIDDRIINRAAEEGRTTQEVAERYGAAFEEVMEAIGVDPPDVLVKATDHVSEMLTMIEGLVARGVAYESEGNVWFSVEKFSEYGKLSGRLPEDLRARERVEPDPSKRNPLDFALWKAAKPEEPSWSSPWGEGRPGWHIECSAMSLKHLGMGFDIHGGGADLIFPHHENEIAQSEAFEETGPFVRYWMHNGLLHIDEEKMSKSLQNFVLLRDLLGRYPPAVVRLATISAHYRSDVDFGAAQLDSARAVYDRFGIFRRSALELTRTDPPDRKGEYVDRFRNAMDDDFNTLTALSLLHDLVRKGNLEIDRLQKGEGDRQQLAGLTGQFFEITGVLGIGFPSGTDDDRDQIAAMVQRREEARRDRRFDEADELRRRLQEMGVVLEDTTGGTRWRRA